MGDLLALLNDISNTAVEMEFCEDFNKLQLILNTTNQFVRPFDKIVFDSGNEAYIIEVVARLLHYLRVRWYLTPDNKVNKERLPQLRRITMYLLLNTDVSFRYDLEQDARVNHLLNSSPQLTKCLLLNCIWGLDLDRFFYEMLRYAPLWFSMQFLDQAIVSLKYAKPYEVLERVESMVSAIYFAICRTDCDWRKIDRNRYVDQQRTHGRLFDHVADMLRYFNTPDVSKFEGWSKLRKHRYFGFVLKHMFSMTMACLELYFRKPAIPVDPAMSVYELMDDRHVHKPAPAEYTQATDGTLLKINHCLLNTLEMCIMHVTLERFCYWAEIDLFAEGEETVTLQQVIGESAYRLCEELKSHRHFRHSIVRHLTQFALRPKTLAEKAAGMNLGTLMLRIEAAQSPDERLVYLTEFVSRTERVFDNAECLETLEQHWRLLNGSHVRLMVEYEAGGTTESPNATADGEQMEDEDDDELSDERTRLRQLILRVVDVLPAKDFHHLVTFAIDTYGTGFCRYQQPDQTAGIVQLINRLRDASPEGPPNVQQLLFQAPAAFFARLVRTLQESGTQQDRLVDAIVAIIVRHKGIAQVLLRELLEQPDFEPVRSPSVRRFVRALYEVRLFEPPVYIERFLLRALRTAAGQRDHRALCELIRLYGAVCPAYWTLVDMKAAAEETATKRRLLEEATLVLAEIADGWRNRVPPATEVVVEREDSTAGDDPDAFAVVTLALEQLLPTLKQLQTLATNEAKERLLAKVQQEMGPSTQYYFRQHLTVTSEPQGEGLVNGTAGKEENQPDQFAAFLYRDELTATSDDKQISAFLTRVFPQCTRTEALALARDGLLAPHILAAVSTTINQLPADGGLRTVCLANLVQCLVQVLLPDGTDCADAIRTVVALLDERAGDTLGDELAELYRYVRRVAPTIDLSELERSMVRGGPPEDERMDTAGDGPDAAASVDH
uniref:Uncharacterized protein n=1 Tax=Anopheles farauti TaxID=69004 RepID=A0A182Q0I1_9DIPT